MLLRETLLVDTKQPIHYLKALCWSEKLIWCELYLELLFEVVFEARASWAHFLHFGCYCRQARD